MKIIDLRSDTVTRPTTAMRLAMSQAEVGDDVYGEDPTVLRLEATLAEQTNKEAGLFLSSGTQSNLTALLAHCQRGEEFLVGERAHTYWYEAGGAAVLGSIQPQPMAQQADGSLDLKLVASLVKPDDLHHCKSRLLCLENTWHGRVMNPSYPAQAKALADKMGLSMHLDGARLFNAIVKTGVPLADWAAPFDTVSLCLSKGLGAPIGTVLVGSKALIHSARRWRKMLGGGMRQVGILAAAGLYAVAHHVERLAEDHERAQILGQAMAQIEGFVVEPVETNMVYIAMDGVDLEHLSQHMRAQGVLLPGSLPLRLVTHLDIDRADISRTIELFKAYFEAHPLPQASA